MRFDPDHSILAGMATEDLQAQLAALQKAYLDLSSGAKAVSVSYDQGGGAKTVSFTEAELPNLVQAIRLVQAQLGLVTHPRRALGVRF